MMMPRWRVVFKARYDVRAHDKEAAVRAATVEILEEIAVCGRLDLNGHPYPLAGVLKGVK